MSDQYNWQALVEPSALERQPQQAGLAFAHAEAFGPPKEAVAVLRRIAS